MSTFWRLIIFEFGPAGGGGTILPCAEKISLNGYTAMKHGLSWQTASLLHLIGTIHTTCKHGDCAAVRTIEGVINHQSLDPAQHTQV